MAQQTKTVYECDLCCTELPRKQLVTLPPGAFIGEVELPEGLEPTMLCGHCLAERLGTPLRVKVETRVDERVVYRDTSSSSRSSYGGYKGPSGRPFVVGGSARTAPLFTNTSWV